MSLILKILAILLATFLVVFYFYKLNLGKVLLPQPLSSVNESAPTPMEDFSVVWATVPLEAQKGKDLTVKWEVKAKEPTAVLHTDAHYGIKPEALDQRTSIQQEVIPRLFSEKIIFNEAGKVYLKAHAKILGQEAWSEVVEITVK